MGYQRRHLLRDVLDLQDRMNRAFEESLRDCEPLRTPGQWAPQVDVVEDDDALYIRAELPGVKRDNVVVDLTDGMIRISGNKPFTHDNQGENYYMIERQYGSFRRSISVPRSVDVHAVEARLECGILEVRVPKLRDFATRRIPVTAK